MSLLYHHVLQKSDVIDRKLFHAIASPKREIFGWTTVVVRTTYQHMEEAMNTDATSPPARKRQRQDKPAPNHKSQEPRLFAPFRALGLITNHVPFVLQTRSYKGATDGPRIHILTCLGKAWALWEGGKMNLLFVGACTSLPCLQLCTENYW